MAKRLGAACRRAREHAGLSALDIAQSAGVSEPTVSRWENGRRWVYRFDELIAVYERDCGLERDELWRRAVCSRSR